jgi:hypothetical protein
LHSPQSLQLRSRSLILKLLTRRVGALSPDLIAQVEALLVEQVDALKEALLDFSQVADLVDWLTTRQNQ